MKTSVTPNLKDSSQKVASYFDHIAKDFDSYYDQPTSWLQEATNQMLRKPALLKRLQIALEALDEPHLHRVLDIGCGSGVLDVPLTQRGQFVLGIDFSAPMIELAKQKARVASLAIEFRVADFMTEEFVPVDACVALGVLEYFKDPVPFIEKMLQLIPSGGKAVFDLPTLVNFHTPLRIPYLLWRRAKAYFYTKRGAQKLLARVGEQLSSVSFTPYGGGFVVSLVKR